MSDTHRLTDSKFGLTKHCGHWAGPNGPEIPEVTASRAMQLGSAFHLLVEHRINKSTATPKACLAAGGFHGSIARDAECLLGGIVEWFDKFVPPGARSEVGFAFDPQTGRSREIPMAAPRDYSQALAREVPGTVDVFWITEHVDEDGISERVAHVYDWETGRSYYKGPAHSNDQVALGAVKLASVYGCTSAVVGIVHISNGHPELREHEIGSLELEALRLDFMKRGAFQVEDSPPVPGHHCENKFCPVRATCSVSRADAVASIQLATGSNVSLAITDQESCLAVRKARLRAQAFLTQIEKMEKAWISENGGLKLGDGKVFGPRKSSSEGLKEGALELLEGILDMDELELVAPRKTSKTALIKALSKERGEEVMLELRKQGGLKKSTTTRWETK